VEKKKASRVNIDWPWLRFVAATVTPYFTILNGVSHLLSCGGMDMFLNKNRISDMQNW